MFDLVRRSRPVVCSTCVRPCSTFSTYCMFNLYSTLFYLLDLRPMFDFLHLQWQCNNWWTWEFLGFVWDFGLAPKNSQKNPRKIPKESQKSPKIISTDPSTGFPTLISYWLQLHQPMHYLGYSYKNIHNSFIDAERVLKLLTEESSIKD